MPALQKCWRHSWGFKGFSRWLLEGWQCPPGALAVGVAGVMVSRNRVTRESVPNPAQLSWVGGQGVGGSGFVGPPQTLTGLRSDLFLPSCTAPGPESGRCRWLHPPGSAGSDPHLGNREHRQRWQELSTQHHTRAQLSHMVELGRRRRVTVMSFSLGQPSPAPCPPVPVYPSLATELGRQLLVQEAKFSFSSHFQRLRDTLWLCSQ